MAPTYLSSNIVFSFDATQGWESYIGVFYVSFNVMDHLACLHVARQAGVRLEVSPDGRYRRSRRHSSEISA